MFDSSITHHYDSCASRLQCAPGGPVAVYGRDVAFMQEVKLGRLVGLKAGAASRAEVVAIN